MTQHTLAYWKGSAHTADAVREEIARRYGEEEAAKYDPLSNCFTYTFAYINYIPPNQNSEI